MTFKLILIINQQRRLHVYLGRPAIPTILAACESGCRTLRFDGNSESDGFGFNAKIDSVGKAKVGRGRTLGSSRFMGRTLERIRHTKQWPG